jgi:protein RecA
VDNLLVSQPDCGEMALDIVDKLVRSAAVDVIVVDSVAALVPRAELEGDMSDMQIGLQARLMSKAMRKITGSLAVSQCTVIFLNQLRSKVSLGLIAFNGTCAVMQKASANLSVLVLLLGWCDLWFARSDVWRKRVEILRFGSIGYPP